VPLRKDNYVPRSLLFSCLSILAWSMCQGQASVIQKKERLNKERLHFWPKANWKLEQWTHRDLHLQSFCASFLEQNTQRDYKCLSHHALCCSPVISEHLWDGEISTVAERQMENRQAWPCSHTHMCGHSHLSVSFQSLYYVLWHRQASFWYFQLKA